jgi:hypothetical protein
LTEHLLLIIIIFFFNKSCGAGILSAIDFDTTRSALQPAEAGFVCVDAVSTARFQSPGFNRPVSIARFQSPGFNRPVSTARFQPLSFNR